MTKQSAEYILENSKLLFKEDCVILNEVLYEHCKVDNTTECYRFFISVDHYDYVTDPALVDILNKHFNCNAQAVD